MPVNIKADQIVNSNLEAFSFFFTDLQEGQGLVFNVENNRWENAFVASADTTPVVDTGSQTWTQQQAEQLGGATIASELFDATFYGMNSLLFDGSSYLYRDFGSGGSRETMTYSFWCKQDKLDKSMQFLSAGSSVSDQIYMASDNAFKSYLANDLRIDTNPQKFRDTLAWNHFVFTIDTPNNIIRLYQNGKQIETGSLSNNTKLNDSIPHYIGKYAYNDGEYLFGRLANIQFIDGMALGASYFGEYIGANWVPKVYEGAYGANGFWLDFSKTQWDSVDGDGNPTAASILQTVEDVSGNGNHWSAA